MSPVCLLKFALPREHKTKLLSSCLNLPLLWPCLLIYLSLKAWRNKLSHLRNRFCCSTKNWIVTAVAVVMVMAMAVAIYSEEPSKSEMTFTEFIKRSCKIIIIAVASHQLPSKNSQLYFKTFEITSTESCGWRWSISVDSSNKFRSPPSWTVSNVLVL